MDFTILGAGAWGTAMAIHLNRLGHGVHLVARRIDHAMRLASDRVNTDYLPEVTIPINIQIGHEIKPALMEANAVILACPSIGVKNLLLQIKGVKDASIRLRWAVSLSKGMDLETLQTPIDLFAEILPELRGAVLTGPTYASEVASGKPTAMVLASDGDQKNLFELQMALSGDSLRVYTSNDVRGAELGGCLKNVYAIGSGICHGLGLGDNATSALLTRSLHEMVQLGSRLGGKEETFYGLSGFGDLVATCYGSWSRNRSFGERIGEGEKIPYLLRAQNKVVEGYSATRAFAKIVRKQGLESPILKEIYSILYQQKDPLVAVQNLMSRSVKQEPENLPSRLCTIPGRE